MEPSHDRPELFNHLIRQSQVCHTDGPCWAWPREAEGRSEGSSGSQSVVRKDNCSHHYCNTYTLDCSMLPLTMQVRKHGTWQMTDGKSIELIPSSEASECLTNWFVLSLSPFHRNVRGQRFFSFLRLSWKLLPLKRQRDKTGRNRFILSFQQMLLSCHLIIFPTS